MVVLQNTRGVMSYTGQVSRQFDLCISLLHSKILGNTIDVASLTGCCAGADGCREAYFCLPNVKTQGISEVQNFDEKRRVKCSRHDDCPYDHWATALHMHPNSMPLNVL